MNSVQIAETQAALDQLAAALVQAGQIVTQPLQDAYNAAKAHLDAARQHQAHHVLHCPACERDTIIPGLLRHGTIVPCGSCSWAGHASMPHIIIRTVGADGQDCAMPGTPPHDPMPAA